MSVVTAVVVMVCAIIFLADTVAYATSLAARVWALGFMAAILSVLSYAAWQFLPGAWIPAAVGNAAFVATVGCMWAGARVYNNGQLAPPGFVVGLASGATLVATLMAGPDGGPWAGTNVMSAALVVVATLGAFESRRRLLGTTAPSYGLTGALGLLSGYFIARTWVFGVHGPESDVFREWFDAAPSSVVTIILAISVAMSLSVLRANERVRTSPLPQVDLSPGRDGFLDQESFERVMGGQMQRADQRGERLAVVALQISDLSQIRLAFGNRAAQDVARRWRAGLQAAAPLSAFLGQCEPQTALVGLPVADEAQAKRLAGQLSQRVLDELTAADTVGTPVLGVGAALSGTGRHASDLVLAAEDAAGRSAMSLDAAVIVAEASPAAGQRDT